MCLRVVVGSFAILACFAGAVVHGQPTAPTEEDLRRQAAIADFTRRMKEANYPALFEQAAREFNVPADILKGVAFAETRWEHLAWPPGETASPETGMPRPYGIMSLWDNKYFGHSLLEAARLIGKDSEELKLDPLQNMRGAAALLRQLYDQNPKPEGSTEAELESWRYAIRKYCGIPEPDLNARHALDVYTFISRGFHEYGIEWEGRPVNLDPIREETRRILQEEDRKRAGTQAANSNLPAGSQLLQGAGTASPPVKATPSGPTPSPVPRQQTATATGKRNALWVVGGVLAGMIVVLFIRRKPGSRS